jgi:hypothetical protein
MWIGIVRKWRRLLHKWDEPGSESKDDTTDGDGDKKEVAMSATEGASVEDAALALAATLDDDALDQDDDTTGDGDDTVGDLPTMAPKKWQPLKPLSPGMLIISHEQCAHCSL